MYFHRSAILLALSLLILPGIFAPVIPDGLLVGKPHPLSFAAVFGPYLYS
jgi:hypothetical protein